MHAFTRSSIFMFSYRFAEATCRSTIRSARGVIEDIGVETAKKSSGLLNIARCSEKNSERDSHRVLDSFGLGLPIPMTDLNVNTTEIDMQILRLRDWMAYILEHNCFHLMCGLMAPDANRECAILSAFWSRFRHENPTHPIYGMAARGEIDLATTVPIVCHGDEGRGAKRQAFMVVNFHGLLGRGTNPQRRREKTLGIKPRYVKHNLSFRGHTYSNRFLFGCMPKHWYTGEREDVFDALMKAAAEEADFLATTGVKDPHSGKTYRCMMLGVSGDWPWLQKSGNLNRTFNHVQKRLNVRNPPAGVCHLCRAGQNDVPYEQIGTRRPLWMPTLNEQSPFSTPSPFQVIPHDTEKLAELWKFDLFHCYHLGVGRQFLGSYLALLSEIQDGNNVDERFTNLSQSYFTWCRIAKRNAHLKKLSKETITWPKTTVFPVGAWSKGDLTTSLMLFVEDNFRNHDFSDQPLLKLSFEAAAAVNECLRICYSRPLFLGRTDALLIANLGLRFLRRYNTLAEQCVRENRALYIIQPKGHAFHHLMMSLLNSLENPSVQFLMNPLAWSTQCDEDFVGRPSRLSRRTKVGRSQVRRVIQRYLKGAYHQWIKYGYIRRKAKR